MQPIFPYKDIIGSTQLQVGLSTGGQATLLIPVQGIYDVFSPTQPAFISIQQPPVSTAAITSSNGYFIPAGVAPMPFRIPAGAFIVAGSSISSGVLCAEKVANY